jgi:hypothetical protein
MINIRFVLLLTLLLTWEHAQAWFKKDFPLVPESSLLIVTLDNAEQIQPHSFCAEIQRVQSKSQLRCRLDQSAVRDSAANLYLQWLQLNALPGTPARALANRVPQFDDYLDRQKNDYILVFFRNEPEWTMVLFAGGSPTPVAAFTSTKGINELRSHLASHVFKGTWKTSDFWLKREVSEYNDSEQMIFSLFASTGKVHSPRTHGASGVYNLNQNADSSSIYDWIEVPSVLYTLGSIFELNQWIGFEALLQYSNHPVRLAPQDTMAKWIEKWDISQWSFGGAFMLQAPFREKTVFFSTMGFFYAFYTENFRYDATLNTFAPGRFQLVSRKGARVTFGARRKLPANFELMLVTGLRSSGTSRRFGGIQSEMEVGSANLDGYWQIGISKALWKKWY